MASKAFQNCSNKLQATDFKFLRILGNGAFAYVMSAKYTPENEPVPSLNVGEIYALKVVNKSKLLMNKKAKTVLIEKTAMKSIDHPNVIKMYETFQDENSLYFVLELASSQNLFNLLKSSFEIPIELLKNILAEVVLALEYIHSKGIVHRDLKPENILFSNTRKVKLTDFGCAAILEKGGNRKHSFAGTINYMAPEVIDSLEMSEECDLWSLGCIIYQIFTHKTPFASESDYLTIEAIQKGNFPASKNIPYEALDLLTNLLKKNPAERLGSKFNGGFEKLKKHIFFEEIDFENISYENFTSVFQRAVEASNCSDIDSYDSNDLPHTFVENSAVIKTLETYLLPEERILFCGLVEKRKKLFNHRRELVFTDRLRMAYFDPKTGEMKGEIDISKAFNIEESGNGFFLIHVPSRTYRLKSVNESAKDWVEVINRNIINFLYSKKE